MPGGGEESAGVIPSMGPARLGFSTKSRHVTKLTLLPWHDGDVCRTARQDRDAEWWHDGRMSGVTCDLTISLVGSAVGPKPRHLPRLSQLPIRRGEVPTPESTSSRSWRAAVRGSLEVSPNWSAFQARSFEHWSKTGPLPDVRVSSGLRSSRPAVDHLAHNVEMAGVHGSLNKYAKHDPVRRPFGTHAGARSLTVREQVCFAQGPASYPMSQ